jgi:DNA-binding transcriptional ArsR family regulator
VPAPAPADVLDRTFHALADSSRRSIVVRLSEGPVSVSELAEPLDMSLSAVVQHIEVLQKCGIVSSKKVGRVRTCQLEPAPMREVEHWIAQHRKAWEGRLDLLGDILKSTHGRTP